MTAGWGLTLVSQGLSYPDPSPGGGGAISLDGPRHWFPAVLVLWCSKPTAVLSFGPEWTPSAPDMRAPSLSH